MDNTDNNYSYNFRPYRKGDFHGVAQLWELTGLGSPERGDNESTIEESIRIGGNLLIMEEKNSRTICGSSWMTFDGRRIHLHHFGILPGCQGQGLSKILLKESLKFVREKGVQVKLEVNTTNEKAINLYKKFGFAHLGNYNVYIIRDITNIANHDF
jgi:ribosomal protein S18 acetylase RimI-like enzyme